MSRDPDHRDSTRTPGCRALILCCLAVAAVATAAAQGARGADVSDSRGGTPGGLSDTRSAENTLEAFRMAYAEMGRPRIEVQVSGAAQRDTSSSSSAIVVEDKSGAREVERAVTRVLRLGGAILEDPRAQANARSADSDPARSSTYQTSNNLVVEVRFEGRNPCSVRLRIVRRSDGDTLAEAEAEGTSSRAAETATLALLQRLAASR